MQVQRNDSGDLGYLPGTPSPKTDERKRKREMSYRCSQKEMWYGWFQMKTSIFPFL
jgi:hypothetical protein